MKKSGLLLLGLSFSANLFAQDIPESKALSPNSDQSMPIVLLDDNLSLWQKWIGCPHTGVTGLPPGTPLGNGKEGVPLGLNDPKGVFTVSHMDGERVLRASGEIYGGLATIAEYENYHLHLQYKWGTTKWAPRLDQPRDMGLMFHCTGTFEESWWHVFMRGIEFQICEQATGDIWLTPNNARTVRPFIEARADASGNWAPNAPYLIFGQDDKTHVTRSDNYESGINQWTTLDLYTVERSAVYVVNGHVVMAYKNASLQLPDNVVLPLNKGKIQLQSEGCEGYYKDIVLTPISEIPARFRKAARLDSNRDWKLGLALYTFHTVSLEEQLEQAAAAGIKHIEGYSGARAGAEFNNKCLKQFSPEEAEKLKSLIKSKGLEMESLYFAGLDTVASWEKEFALAKQLNVKFVTCEPPLALLDGIDRLAGTYGIKVAIHNHFKGMGNYWSPDAVLSALKGHPHFWACPDVGHWPKSGINPVEGLKKMEGHILAIHPKDIAEYNNPTLQDLPLGTGVINFPDIIKELDRQNFAGWIVLERDAKTDPVTFHPLYKA